jgi:hypothetical protein
VRTKAGGMENKKPRLFSFLSCFRDGLHESGDAVTVHAGSFSRGENRGKRITQRGGPLWRCCEAKGTLLSLVDFVVLVRESVASAGQSRRKQSWCLRGTRRGWRIGFFELGLGGAGNSKYGDERTMAERCEEERRKLSSRKKAFGDGGERDSSWGEAGRRRWEGMDEVM